MHRLWHKLRILIRKVTWLTYLWKRWLWMLFWEQKESSRRTGFLPAELLVRRAMPACICSVTKCRGGFPGGSDSKRISCNAGDQGSIPGSERSPGGGNGNPPQYSSLGNPMDRGAWWATAHGVAESWIRLSDWTEQLSTYTHNQGQKQGDQLRSYCNNPGERWRWLKEESQWWRVAESWNT